MPFGILSTRLRIALLLLLLLLAIPASTTPAQAQSATLPPANPEGSSLAVTQRGGLEGRVMWLDGTANLQRLSTRAGVADVLEHCARAHINTVVVDVKPLSGHVLYQSQVAPMLKEWRGFQYPAGFDLLRVALDEGHKRGLRIHAAINVFSNGHKLVRTGPLFEKPDGQSIIYDVERSFTTPRGDQKTVGVGLNRPPAADGVAAYDSGGSPRVLGSGEVGALITQDQVVSVTSGFASPNTSIDIPLGSYLLVGRGESARWMAGGGVVPGDSLTWASSTRMLPIIEAPSETVAAFVNPADPAARDYMMRVVRELVSNYPIDGIVFDRMRYASLQSDFSEQSRQEFEKYLGIKLNRFPEDIYSFDPNPGKPLVWGPYFRTWLEWRARNIRTWLEDAAKFARERRPAIKVGVYVGSWYTTYYTVGVNWGAEEFAPGYDWMSQTYPTTGYAGLLDWLCTGCYYPVATRTQAKEAGLDDNYTVQAAAELSTRAAGDMAFVYAGLYVLDYRGAPAAFREAIRTARNSSHGVMLFDLSQLEEYGWWGLLEEEFPDTRTAPHDVPDLLASVRALRRALAVGARNTLAQ